jgi:type II secretory ATPase GspE/PulE/Tfp pilus assembly ATPase PilB-like protein
MEMTRSCARSSWNGANATQLKKKAVESGMISLRADGVDKIRSRQTTPDEVLRVTQLDMG